MSEIVINGERLSNEEVGALKKILYSSFHNPSTDRWVQEAIAGLSAKAGFDRMAEEMDSDLDFESKF